MATTRAIRHYGEELRMIQRANQRDQGVGVFRDFEAGLFSKDWLGSLAAVARMSNVPESSRTLAEPPTDRCQGR